MYKVVDGCAVYDPDYRHVPVVNACSIKRRVLLKDGWINAGVKFIVRFGRLQLKPRRYRLVERIIH